MYQLQGKLSCTSLLMVSCFYTVFTSLFKLVNKLLCKIRVFILSLFPCLLSASMGMSSQFVVMEMLWLLTLLMSMCPSHALNLDELSPTVVRSGVLDEGVGFGWSMAQHRLSNNTNM